MESKLNVKIIGHTVNPELVIATAGKLCYSPSNIEALMEKQTDEDVKRFVNMLVSMAHESPLEHSSFTFAIEGVSRSLTHQLVRHRIASYSQQSQRYVSEKQFDYIIPKHIKRNSAAAEVFVDHMIETQETYNKLVDLLLVDYLVLEEEQDELKRICKRCKADYDELNACIKNEIESMEKEDNQIIWKEDRYKLLNTVSENYKRVFSALTKRAIENARAVLPNATETKIICTMNLRSLINFCHHRCCRRAQDEIFELAWAMKNEVEKISPLLGKCLGATCQFSKCPEGSMTCGVPFEKIS